MVKYIVTTVSRNRETGLQIGRIKNETIDTVTNSLFPNNDIMDIKKRYESFWNDINPYSKEIVTVLKIKRKGAKK